MSKSELFILGNFGLVTGHLDGQTMESRTLLELLEIKGIRNIDYFDTERLHFRKSSVFEMLGKAIRTKRLFYLGAQGSLKYLLPILWIVTKVFRIEFHYFVVGGWIAEFIKDKPVHQFMLKRINGMYCETHSIVNKLRTWYNFKHAFWFPNFRIYDFEPTIEMYSENPLRLVFMSRIAKSKGFDCVFRLAKNLNKEIGKDAIIIDFYGPLNDLEKEDFLRGIEEFSFMQYKGILQPKEINMKLAEYDIMLFPTSYSGEGFPGTILDSYISGIPVIASNWRYNSELIEHGKSGFIFDLNNESEFHSFVKELFNNRKLLYEMKINAHAKSKDFNLATIWNIITEHTGLK